MMEKTLTLKNHIEEIALLAPFVEELCEEMGLGMDRVFNLNLVLEEAVTNVVMYAYPQGEEHELWVKATADGGMLTLTVEDEGVPFDPTAEAPEVDVTLSAEEREIGGLGIFLISQMMDEVGYERKDERNILTMKLKIDAQE